MPFDNSWHEEPVGDLELLRIAKGLISTPDRWIKSVYFDKGRYCAVAALIVASTGDIRPKPRRLTDQERRLARYLCREMPVSQRMLLWFLTARVKLISYNDGIATHDDMMHLFDRAIDRLYHTKLRRTIESY